MSVRKLFFNLTWIAPHPTEWAIVYICPLWFIHDVTVYYKNVRYLPLQNFLFLIISRPDRYSSEFISIITNTTKLCYISIAQFIRQTRSKSNPNQSHSWYLLTPPRNEIMTLLEHLAAQFGTILLRPFKKIYYMADDEPVVNKIVSFVIRNHQNLIGDSTKDIIEAPVVWDACALPKQFLI